MNEQVVRDLAGEDAHLAAYTGNTNSPDTKAQPLHSDVRRDQNEMGVATLVTNILLVDATQANGSIELCLARDARVRCVPHGAGYIWDDRALARDRAVSRGNGPGSHSRR